MKQILCGFEPNANGEYPIEAYREMCDRLNLPFPIDMAIPDVSNSSCKFDRNGNKWQAMQLRNQFSIEEFASLIADCDESKTDCGTYQRLVSPYIDVLIELVKERRKEEDIPF